MLVLAYSTRRRQIVEVTFFSVIWSLVQGRCVTLCDNGLYVSNYGRITSERKRLTE